MLPSLKKKDAPMKVYYSLIFFSALCSMNVLPIKYSNLIHLLRSVSARKSDVSQNQQELIRVLKEQRCYRAAVVGSCFGAGAGALGALLTRDPYAIALSPVVAATCAPVAAAVAVSVAHVWPVSQQALLQGRV